MGGGVPQLLPYPSIFVCTSSAMLFRFSIYPILEFFFQFLLRFVIDSLFLLPSEEFVLVLLPCHFSILWFYNLLVHGFLYVR